MANATELKFGDPDGRLAQTDCWTLLLRPKQPTLGSMVLVCREPVQALGDVSERAFVELRGLTRAIEAVLRDFVGYQRINYLVLMMVDRDVHLHVIPRYDGKPYLRRRGVPGCRLAGPAGARARRRARRADRRRAALETA